MADVYTHQLLENGLLDLITEDVVKRFTLEYMRDLNGTAAVKRLFPKFSHIKAHELAHQLQQRPDVRKLIDKALAEISAAAQLDQARILQFLEEIASFDPIDCFDRDGALRPLADIPLAARRCLKVFESVTTTSGNRKITVQFHSRVEILRLLGQYLRMFSNGPEVGAKVTFVLKGLQDDPKVIKRELTAGVESDVVNVDPE